MVGNGTIRSNDAAFTVSVGKLSPQGPSRPQTVYLDFGPDPNAIFGANVFNAFTLSNDALFLRYSKTDSGIAPEQFPVIVSRLNQIYSAYSVTFTTTPPSSGPYSTVFIGPKSDIPSADLQIARVSSDTIGLASSIDYQNQNTTDTAVVFTDRFVFPPFVVTDGLGRQLC